MADAPASGSLKVALVLPQSSGGIGQHCLMLARHLAAGGDEVTVLAPEDTLARFAFAATGAGVIAADPASPTGLWRRGELRRLLGHQHVVHGHGVRVGAALTAVGVAPLVVTWHNAPVGSWWRRVTHAALERMSARASVVLVASEDLGERARRAGAREVRFCPVAAPSLPRVQRVGGSPPGAGSPVVLAIARLQPQKRLDLLVSATAGWRERPDHPRVLVIGDGPDRERLAALAARVGSPLELLGHRDDVADLLAQATVAVLPSDWEARPLAAQEALRAGVPLVATAVGGVPGLVGDAALLVPPGDAMALRSALERLLDDAALRRSLAAAGPVQASTWPSEADMATVVRAAYLEVRSRVSGI